MPCLLLLLLAVSPMQVKRSGTTADKVAAMSLLVSSSAAASLKSLDGLLGMMAKSGGGRQVVVAALEALQVRRHEQIMLLYTRTTRMWNCCLLWAVCYNLYKCMVLSRLGGLGGGSSAAASLKSVDGLLGMMAKSGGGRQVVVAALEALQVRRFVCLMFDFVHTQHVGLVLLLAVCSLLQLVQLSGVE
jgi:hypothetical protein